MNDQLDRIFADLRADLLREVKPPGADEVRRTVRRRRGVAGSAGAVLAVAAVASGIAVTGGLARNDAAPTGPSPTPSFMGRNPTPPPGPEALRMEAAYQALNADKVPDVMSTGGVAAEQMVDSTIILTADDYQLHVVCLGPGTIDLVLRAENRGNAKVLAGRISCGEKAAPVRFPFTQPTDGELELILSGDKQAIGHAGYAFKFVRKSDIKPPAAPESTANAGVAARLLGEAGIPGAKKLTTEEDQTLDEVKPAGDYLASFACAGPGNVTFIIRSAPALRDGTVSTVDSTTHTATTVECTAAGKLTKDVAMALPAGSGFTITAEADAAARNKAGWAYSFRAG